MTDGVLDNPLLVFGFLSIFHLIGGAAIGLGWRQWAAAWRAKDRRTPPFLFLWGVLLGLLPLLFALVTRDMRVLGGQAATLVVGWALAFWLARPLSEAVSRRFLWFIILGLVLMIAGSLLAVLAMDVTPEELWQRLAFGGLLFAIGSLILAAGLVQWFRPRRKEAPAPEPAVAAPPIPVEPPVFAPPAPDLPVEAPAAETPPPAAPAP